MFANISRFSEARFTPGLRRHRWSRTSSALLITLTIIALVTILVVAFLGLASQDLKSTNFYVRSEQSDQIARAGLDFVVGNLQGEIQDGAFSTTNFGTTQSPFYLPIAATNNFPMRMVSVGGATTNILLTSLNTTFYNGGLAFAGTTNSAIPSTNTTVNNQVITVSDWNKPMLVPGSQAASMPVPNWIFVSRAGPIAVAANTTSSTVSPSLGNTSAVIGRYAFVVYDISGLLDINVAGYDASQATMSANAPGKGLLPYADLTQLPGITAGDVNALVQFRNAVSETNFPLALTNTGGPNMVSNGFMQVYAPTTGGTSDSTFLSRQELIQYANNTGNTDWTNALPYLTTFSRELNGPIWGPTTNPPNYSYGGKSYSFPYQTTANSSTTATATTTLNPNSFAVRVPAAWANSTTTRNNGLPWAAGDPLVKYRFPLDKLALLAKVQSTLTAQDIKQIQAYFGLDVAPDIQATTNPGFYRHWVYPTANAAYAHTAGTILTLAQVAALSTPREPDFFELLQAGILQGSLGGWGRGDGTTTQDYDTKTTVHLMRIGANIINQWQSDAYPTTITFSLPTGSIDVYGVSDLPYITQLIVKGFSPEGNLTAPILPYIYFQVWNPHQAPAAYDPANYPSSLRIVPFTFNPPGGSAFTSSYSDNFSLFFAVTPNLYSSGAFKWFTSGSMDFFSLSPTYGGGYETNASSGLLYTPFNPYTDYREPGLLVGSPHPVLNYTGTNAVVVWTPPASLGGGSPTGTLAAISLPGMDYPTNHQPPNSIPGKYNGQTSPIPIVNWTNTFPSTNAWRFGYASQTVFAQQFKDANGNWHTYGTFEGVDEQTTALAGYSGYNSSGWWVCTSGTSTSDVAWAKVDPRTERFGPGGMGQTNAVNSSSVQVFYPTTNAPTAPLFNPSSTLPNIAWNINSIAPFGNNPNVNTNAPFRMDYWAVNNPNNAMQGPGITTGTNTPAYADLDGIVRGGDSAYAYSTSTSSWGGNPEVPGTSFSSVALPARPVMLNHPFHSVGDLGYAYRDDPWRTLDFMTPGSADAGLLDLFNLSEAPVVAGRINPNTPYTPVIAALVSGATQSSLTNNISPSATVPAASAQSVAQSFVNFAATSPMTNRASLVTSGAVSNVINGGYFTDNGTKSMVKTEGESLVRSLAESSNTRTWNLLIDVIGQSGHFVNNSSPVTSGGKDNFVVDGERRYWLHVAIDRYTGKIVDEQLELVDQ